ncbi:MAG: FAD-binding oxidoreductase [Gammaproteobacteria bacterium]|nr:FAD-binding oxidoreductase [Gammaproteobacteria bacterium]
MAIQKFDLILSEASMITPRVRELVFERADGEPLQYTPGQFITLLIDTPEKELRRSYSISTIPDHADGIRIAVAEVEGGRATRFLFAMQPGEQVPGSGPFGRFILREDDNPRYVMIATGTGVTPYRTFIPELERRLEAKDCSVELLLGVRSPEELLYADDFKRLEDKYENFNFHPCYSRVMPEEPGKNDKHGYVQAHVDSLSLNSDKDILYLCGNPEMVDIVAEKAKELGFPIVNVRREKYVSSN